MNIDAIDMYRVRYTPRSGPFMLSGGRTFSHFEGLILRIRTDAGLVGWGEHASAPSYMTALHGGAEASLRLLAPLLIGRDPTAVAQIGQVMDEALQGHAYAKSAIDLACWDILGKKAGLPLSMLLGGTYRSEIPILDFIPIGEPEQMAARSVEIHSKGFRTLQIKIGLGGWREDLARIEAVLDSGVEFTNLVVDANGALLPHEALQLLGRLQGRDFMLEQPCASLESNITVRRHSSIPMILDESLDSVLAVEHAHEQTAFDGAMLKLSRLGGPSNLRVARDACIRWGKTVTMEDMAGGAIVTAASTHLAASTPPKNLLSGSCTGLFMQESYGRSVTYPEGTGTVQLPTGDGLGVEMDEKALGRPIRLA